MKKEKSRIVYEVEEIKDFRELINRAYEKYPENTAYKYKIKNNNEDFHWAKAKPLYIQPPSITKPKELKNV